MKRFILAFIILCYFQNANAQYTEIINSKRPGFSESPYGVGSDVYQFELGLFYNHSNSPSPNDKKSTFGTELFFRFGKIIEKLEVNLNVAYQGDKIYSLNQNYSGISDFRIGAKYLIYQKEYTDQSKEIRSWKARTSFDKKRLIPSVGVYVGVLPNFVSEPYKNESVSFRVAALLQNDFTDRLVLVTNLMADEIASENMFYSYLVTVTYALSSNWSFFVENVGRYSKLTSPEYQLGIGTAYLLSPDLQVDASVRTLLLNNTSEIYAAAGVAWRIDRHKDQVIKNNNDLSGSGKKKKKKGFFSNLFKKNK